MKDFTIIVLPGAYASSVAVTLDILHAAAVLAPRLNLTQPTWRVISPSGQSIKLSNGMHIDVAMFPKRQGPDLGTWIVPGLGLDSPSALAKFLATSCARKAMLGLSKHLAGGGRAAASCSAVFLLQAAGLLPKRRVTTSWWLAAELRRLEPLCVVDADRMVCADGPISTAGAAFAQTDLMLHLLKNQFGFALADAVGRVLLIDGRHAQAPFVLPEMLSNGNELVDRLMQRNEASLPNPLSVRELAREFSMSQRTLSRHVIAATGRSTMALFDIVRLNRAKVLIASSKISIEQVAGQVGYGDSTALRRLVRKAAGANPSQYRSAHS